MLSDREIAYAALLNGNVWKPMHECERDRYLQKVCSRDKIFPVIFYEKEDLFIRRIETGICFIYRRRRCIPK